MLSEGKLYQSNLFQLCGSELLLLPLTTVRAAVMSVCIANRAMFLRGVGVASLPG